MIFVTDSKGILKFILSNEAVEQKKLVESYLWRWNYPNLFGIKIKRIHGRIQL